MRGKKVKSRDCALASDLVRALNVQQDAHTRFTGLTKPRHNFSSIKLQLNRWAAFGAARLTLYAARTFLRFYILNRLELRMRV